MHNAATKCNKMFIVTVHSNFVAYLLVSVVFQHVLT
jgi:hypothetical protein